MRKKILLYANSKCADQTEHVLSLIRIFVIRCILCVWCKARSRGYKRFFFMLNSTELEIHHAHINVKIVAFYHLTA